MSENQTDKATKKTLTLTFTKEAEIELYRQLEAEADEKDYSVPTYVMRVLLGKESLSGE